MIKIFPKLNELRLNTIFKWYRPDFAPSVSDLTRNLIKFMRGEKKTMLSKMVDEKRVIKITFNDYDWTSNVTNSKKFDISTLRSNESIVGTFCKSWF